MMLLFPALSPKHCFFCFIKQETQKFYEISRNKHKNFVKYEMNYFINFTICRFVKFHLPQKQYAYAVHVYRKQTFSSSTVRNNEVPSIS
jgi:hypothetical protein